MFVISMVNDILKEQHFVKRKYSYVLVLELQGGKSPLKSDGHL